eukprot:557528-Rhodomonas_salina.1
MMRFTETMPKASARQHVPGRDRLHYIRDARRWVCDPELSFSPPSPKSYVSTRSIPRKRAQINYKNTKPQYGLYLKWICPCFISPECTSYATPGPTDVPCIPRDPRGTHVTLLLPPPEIKHEPPHFQSSFQPGMRRAACERPVLCCAQCAVLTCAETTAANSYWGALQVRRLQNLRSLINSLTASVFPVINAMIIVFLAVRPSSPRGGSRGGHVVVTW